MYHVLPVVPVGWNQALNVCQWAHEHLPERVSGISAENRFTDFVAVPPLTLLVHTEYVDNFVGLSKKESVTRDAAERVSDALVKAGLPVHPVTCSLGAETLGWEFDPLRPVVGVSRRVASLHVASLCWASENEISSWFGAERVPGYFQCGLRHLSTRWPSETALTGARHP